MLQENVMVLGHALLIRPYCALETAHRFWFLVSRNPTVKETALDEFKQVSLRSRFNNKVKGTMSASKASAVLIKPVKITWHARWQMINPKLYTSADSS